MWPPPDVGTSYVNHASSMVARRWRRGCARPSASTALRGRGLTWELPLFDDDAGDGSKAVAAALAVVDGIRLARFDLLVVMDADLSHPPERIPDLLAALDGGADIAVGSRYAPGGRIERGWGAGRVANSRVATWLARPLVRCADPMSGFFALRRAALPEPGTLAPVGCKIALEPMVRGRLRVGEVPIDFADRRRGLSKTGWRERWNTLRHLGRLYAFRFEAAARMLRFGLVGASGLAVDVGVYLALGQLGADHRLARFLASPFWPAATWNWRLNRGWTFAGRPPRPRARQWASFVAASLPGLAVNVGSYVALTGLVDALDRHRIVALLLGVAAGAGVNYLVANWWVYRRGARGTEG